MVAPDYSTFCGTFECPPGKETKSENVEQAPNAIDTKHKKRSGDYLIDTAWGIRTVKMRG